MLSLSKYSSANESIYRIGVFMSQISTQIPTQRIVRLPEVMDRTGLSRSSIYNFLSAGSFPSRIKLGARSIGFLEADINDWISSKIAEASV